MKRKRLQLLLIAVLVALLFGCASTQVAMEGTAKDPLPSWSEGAAKRSILAFVERVTDKTSPSYVPPPERIATFDNDGTLWAEKPIYFQMVFIVDQMRKRAEADPSMAQKQPYKAILEGDRVYLGKMDQEELIQTLFTFLAGQTPDQYQADVREWLNTARHPRYNRLYTELTYQPMLELLEYLRASGFHTWICTGGSIDFVRAFAEEVYGVPPEKVIGSSLKYKFEETSRGPVVTRQPILSGFNDKQEKPANIQLHIGRTPIVAVGNSDGDLAMLQFTDDKKGPALMVLVHHDDPDREYDYDRGTEKALKVAQERGWTVVNIKTDFENVFPFENR